jgi:phospholipid transport system substrate-binding protein
MKRIVFLLAAMLAVLSVGAGAGPYGYRDHGTAPGYALHPAPLPPRPDMRTSTPVELLRDGIWRTRAYLAENPGAANVEHLKFLEENISHYFDFERMAYWVGGDHYRRMNAQEKYHFQNRLRDMFFSALARQLGVFSRPLPRVAFGRPRMIGPNEMQVSARVIPERGYPVRIQFRFFRTPNCWKVYDVTSNGVSAVVYYRDFFRKQLRQRAGGRS